MQQVGHATAQVAPPTAARKVLKGLLVGVVLLVIKLFVNMLKHLTHFSLYPLSCNKISVSITFNVFIKNITN